MDTLHSVLFYAFAAVTVVGGLAAALLGGRRSALGLGAVAVGVAGLLADLDAGFAAVFTLVALGACALLVLRLPEPAETAPPSLDRQAGAALAGLGFLVLAYVAFRGDFVGGSLRSGVFNAAALGRLFFERDALATLALAGALLAAVLGLAPSTRVRRR